MELMLEGDKDFNVDEFFDVKQENLQAYPNLMMD